MSHFVIVGMPIVGQINPLLGPARHLLAAGHRVSWLSGFLPTAPGAAARLTSSGIEVLPDPPLTPVAKAPLAPAEQLALYRDRDGWIARWRSAWVDGAAVQLEHTRSVLRDVRPDAALVSPTLYQGVLAATLERIPFLSSSTTLRFAAPPELTYRDAEDMAAIAPARDALFGQSGVDLEFRQGEAVSPWASTLFTTEAFVGSDAARAPAGTKFVGPSLAPAAATVFPWERLAPERPILYASFGSWLTGEPHHYRAIAIAGHELGMQVVLVGGHLVGSELSKTLPSETIIVPFAPQLELLARATACVSHGGANTTAEALYFGVPLVVIPLIGDQPIQAHFVERAGAGLHLEGAAVTPEAMFEALRRLLVEPSFRTTAGAIRASFRERDGARSLADLALELARR